jgi:hypothetical protein
MTGHDNDIGHDIAGWLDVDAYALAAGISARTVRRRLAAGQLTARKVLTRNGEEWRILPPETPPPSAGAASSAAAPDTALIPLAQLEHLLAPLAAERDRLRVELTETRAALAAVQETRIADARERGRLQGLLEAAQAEIARLRDNPPAPADTPPAESARVLDRRSRFARGFRSPWSDRY